MKRAYLAICYLCNENCLFCPCSQKEKTEKMITDIQELIHTVNLLETQGITDVTISGGEPTLHPHFVELVKYIQQKGMDITILTNSERFHDNVFLLNFIREIDVNRIKIITTLHSSEANEHEQANQTKGSFERSVKGLLSLSDYGVRIIIKHCVTKANYKDLKDFYMFIDSTFKLNVDVQLCSIDYCGIPKNQLINEMLSFVDLRPYLEEVFDYHISMKDKGFNRNLYCINMPLCSSDVIYWDYFSKKRKVMYNAYKDPHNEKMVSISNNVGINDTFCENCKAKSICSGTYYTAFEAFKDRIIKPFV